MTYNLIDYSKNFDGKMAAVKTRWSIKDVHSVHTTGKNGQGVSVSLYSLFNAMRGEEQPSVAIITGKDFGYAELQLGNSTEVAICRETSAGSVEFFASVIDNATGTLMPFPSNTVEPYNVFTAAYIAYRYEQDGELQSVLTDLMKYPSDRNADEWDDPIICESFGMALCLFSQNLYHTLKNANALQIQSENLRPIRQSDLKKVTEKGKRNVYGTTVIVEMQQHLSSTENYTQGCFAIDAARELSPEEKALIPVMPSSYVWPSWVVNICKEIKESTRFSEPTRNILLSGMAGTGKTTGAMGISFLTGLPYVKITCSPDTDMFDIIGQMLPNTEKEDVNEILSRMQLPSFEDVANAPKETFLSLFGREMDEMYDSEADCYVEIFNRLREGLSSTKDFVYVKSNFIRGIVNGWVVELQEPNVIKKKSVLVGLNGIMENSADVASITLPTGENIKRHRDAIVIITTNGDYDGCTTLQQSVLSRVQSVYHIEAPEVATLAERVQKNTGFKTKTLLFKMAQFILECASYCRDHDITDGVCGQRELQNWAKKAILVQLEMNHSEEISEEAVVYAAFPTVIAKASQNSDEQEEILTAVFCTKFSQTLVQEAKEMYTAGNI